MRRLEKELNEMQKMKEHGIDVAVKESLYRWEIQIRGPIGSPFEGYNLLLDVDFPENYPFKFPEVKFSIPVWHPNVKDGQLCKQMIGQTDWEPSKNIKLIVESVLSMLVHPDLENAINSQAAAQCTNGTYFDAVRTFQAKNSK